MNVNFFAPRTQSYSQQLPAIQKQEKFSAFKSVLQATWNGVSSWHPRAVRVLESCEDRLDRWIPNFGWQKEFDNTFSEGNIFDDDWHDGRREINEWIDSNGDGEWYEQAVICVAKLPIRAARNLLGLLSAIVTILIKWPVYVAVHPLKAPLKLAEKFFDLIHVLTQPEVWSRMGASMAGTAYALSWAAGSPLSVITMTIAGAMVAGGVTVGTLKAALEDYRGKKLHAAGNHLVKEATVLPEMALTGFCTGAIIGGIQRFMRWTRHLDQTSKSRAATANEQAAAYAEKKGLPEGYKVTSDDKTICLSWDLNKFPELRYDDRFSIETYQHVHVLPDGRGGAIVIPGPVELLARQRVELVGWTPPPKPPIPGEAFWVRNNPVLGAAYTLKKVDSA